MCWPWCPEWILLFLLVLSANTLISLSEPTDAIVFIDHRQQPMHSNTNAHKQTNKQNKLIQKAISKQDAQTVTLDLLQ